MIFEATPGSRLTKSQLIIATEGTFQDLTVQGNIYTFIVNPEAFTLRLDFSKHFFNNFDFATVMKWPEKYFSRLSFQNKSVEYIPLDSHPNLSGNLSNLFYGCEKFNKPLRWDTSRVINMSDAFNGASLFNQPLRWDTFRVNNMRNMFHEASEFNQTIEHWDTMSVVDMGNMFCGASLFNQPIGNWNTMNVTNMSFMFSNAESFNQPLYWNTLNVANMRNMFSGAKDFNQRLDFNTSNVTHMNFMFDNAESFNSPFGPNFNTSKVYNMGYMFNQAKSFNQPFDPNFITENVRNMERMFYGAESFNQLFGENFDTKNVKFMDNMFKNALAFNLPFEFNVSNIENVEDANVEEWDLERQPDEEVGNPFRGFGRQFTIFEDEGILYIQNIKPEEVIDDTIIEEGEGLEKFHPKIREDGLCSLCLGHMITIKDDLTTYYSVLTYSLGCLHLNPNADLHIFHHKCFKIWKRTRNVCPVDLIHFPEMRTIIIPNGTSQDFVETIINNNIPEQLK